MVPALLPPRGEEIRPLAPVTQDHLSSPCFPIFPNSLTQTKKQGASVSWGRGQDRTPMERPILPHLVAEAQAAPTQSCQQCSLSGVRTSLTRFSKILENALSLVVFVGGFTEFISLQKLNDGPKTCDSRLRTRDKMPPSHTVHFLPGYQLLFVISQIPSLLQEGSGLFREIHPCYRSIQTKRLRLTQQVTKRDRTGM